MRLNNDPEVLKLVRDLHLPRGGDALRRIRDFAIARVGRTLTDSPVPVEDLDTLRAVVANKFGVRLEFLTEDSDVLRVGEHYVDFHRLLPHRLQEEFVRGKTEGITLQREDWDRIQFRYLAVVDARGRRASRAFFTAWHEITHLIVHPEQLPFPGFRRTSNEEIHKDPIESVVDYVAARGSDSTHRSSHLFWRTPFGLRVAFHFTLWIWPVRPRPPTQACIRLRWQASDSRQNPRFF